MRARSQKDGVSVHAIAGTYVVLLGLNATRRAAKGLLGFAIQRRDVKTAQKYWMKGPRLFEESEGGGKSDSSTDPIQGFMWSDYRAVPGRAYSYTVVPMYGTPGNLRKGKGVTVKVTTERDDDKQHGIFFNRGVAGSQAFSRRFGKYAKWYEVAKYGGRTSWEQYVKPEQVPDGKAWRWLSRGLEEAMLKFIAQAKGPAYALRAAVYEFEFEPAIQAFVTALESGADVKIIHHAKKDSSGIAETAIKSVRAVGIRKGSMIRARKKMLIPRTQTTIHHNKFIVLLKDDEPIQVWTGSTNFTAGGIYGQSNVGHAIRDPEVAAKYYEYWQKLETDPGKRTLKKAPEDVGMRDWTVDSQPDLEGPPPPNSVTPIFSPRLTTAMLEWYAERLAKAESSVHFTAAFGVSQELAEKLVKRKRVKKGQPYQRYILLESRRNPSKNRPGYKEFLKVGQNRIAVGELQKKRRGASDEAWRPLAETLTGLNTFVAYLHTKYMLIDPLSDDPVVITGSANFSEASTVSNDENMLVIRGNKRVADIFLGEFMRLFNHFHIRNRLNEMSDEEYEESFYLSEDDSWTAAYFEQGTQENAERLLFS